MPRVMNVDKNPAYPGAMEALKADGSIPRRVALRQCKYLNNVIEQGHRTVKKRVWLAKGYGSFQSAWRTLQGIEAVNMIRKGRVRWLAKGDVVGQGSLHRRTVRTFYLTSIHAKPTCNWACVNSFRTSQRNRIACQKTRYLSEKSISRRNGVGSTRPATHQAQF